MMVEFSTLILVLYFGGGDTFRTKEKNLIFMNIALVSSISMGNVKNVNTYKTKNT